MNRQPWCAAERRQEYLRRAGWIGIRGTLWVGAGGTVLSALPVLLSPLRRMRDIPREPQACADHQPS